MVCPSGGILWSQVDNSGKFVKNDAEVSKMLKNKHISGLSLNRIQLVAARARTAAWLIWSEVERRSGHFSIQAEAMTHNLSWRTVMTKCIQLPEKCKLYHSSSLHTLWCCCSLHSQGNTPAQWHHHLLHRWHGNITTIKHWLCHHRVAQETQIHQRRLCNFTT